MSTKIQAEILLPNEKALWYKSKLESLIKELNANGKFKKISSLKGEKERYIKNITKVIVKYLSVSSQQLPKAQEYSQSLFIGNKGDFMLEVVNYWDNQLIVIDLQKNFNQTIQSYFNAIDSLLLQDPCSYKNAEEALYHFKGLEFNWKEKGKINLNTVQSQLLFELEANLQITANNKRGQIITEIDESQNADIKQQKPNMLANSQKAISNYISKQQPSEELIKRREELLDNLTNQNFLPFMKELEKVLRNEGGV